jgi:hypothetical protein
MGEYIGRIYDEVRARPQYVVKEVGPHEVSSAKTDVPSNAQLIERFLVV